MMVERQPGGTPPSTGAPASAGPESGARQDKGAEARIAALTREKHQANERNNTLQSDVQSMREEIAELRGNVSASGAPSTGNGHISSYKDIKDLPGAFNAALNPENPNPSALYGTVDEMVNRRLEEEKAKWLQETQEQRGAENYAKSVESRILQDFPDASNPESDLFQSASSHMHEMRQQFGQDVFEKDPAKLHHAFSMAQNHLRAGQSTELEELRTKAAGLQRTISAMETGSNGMRPQSEGVSEALEQRDPMAAIRALKTVRGV